jgi:anti-sigma B factor antagonist
MLTQRGLVRRACVPIQSPRTRMADPGSEQSSVDTRGVRAPSVYAIDARTTPEGVVVLTLDGEFDLAAAPAVRERLAAALAAGAPAIVIDMAEVTFVDSSVLRELLRAESAQREDGVPLLLAALRAPVARLLELTQTNGLLTVVPTVDEALRRAVA